MQKPVLTYAIGFTVVGRPEQFSATIESSSPNSIKLSAFFGEESCMSEICLADPKAVQLAQAWLEGAFSTLKMTGFGEIVTLAEMINDFVSSAVQHGQSSTT